MTLSLPVDADANELLSRSPLALLIGMLLDQQVTLEKAFTSPRDLVRRLGHEPTAQELADYDPEALVAIFSERPALHRYPRAMAARVQQLCQLVVDRYHGDAASVWAGAPTGQDLLTRINALPGFLTWFAKFLPLTHGLALVRYGLLRDSSGLHNIWSMGNTTAMAGLSLAVVVVFAVALTAVSVRVFTRTALR